MIKRLLLPILILALNVTVAGAETLTENLDKTYDLKAGALFSLENTNGRIAISSWDQPRVRIQAHKKVESSSNARAKEVMAKVQVIVTSDARGVHVTTKMPNENGGGALFDWLRGNQANASVEYDVTLPRTLDLDIDNTNGQINVGDVSGRLKVGTTNGKITLERCAGSLDAETTNGRITAELLSVTRGEKVSLETTNGHISLSIPATLGANIDASTTNGGIDTDIPLLTKGHQKDELRGTMNGGGAEIRLRTTNGGIDIHSTGSGNSKS